jgi:peptidoglycan/xylan/chitin deacetylase (PgdA/CDA1 family)
MTPRPQNQSAHPIPGRIVYLMYHELELPGRPPCQSEPGYVRYIVHEAAFRSQMAWLKSAGIRGMSVGEALTFPEQPGVAITFDDGCETDCIAAAPLLKEAGFGGTFYITVGFMKNRGYLSARQVRELADLGFEVGCHSMTHPYLSELSLEALRRELVDPKTQLEEMAGRAVEHFSCPGGRWNERVAQVAREAGYKSVATSRNSVNHRLSDAFSLGRVAVLRGTRMVNFQQVCRGQGLWRLQLQDLARTTAKRVMGNSGYDRLRALLLGGSDSPSGAPR